MSKLGSPKASHTAAGKQAVAKIEREADSVIQQAKQGRCQAATISYAEMQRATGAAEAHMRSGGSVYIPTTTLQEAAFEYNEHCVRESRGIGNSGERREPPKGVKREPPPVFFPRQGPPPGVPLRGRRRRMR